MKKDNEPSLEKIDDYVTLKGNKKKVVWLVILSGLLIGLAYFVAIKLFSPLDDSIPIENPIGKIPVR